MERVGTTIREGETGEGFRGGDLIEELSGGREGGG